LSCSGLKQHTKYKKQGWQKARLLSNIFTNRLLSQAYLISLSLFGSAQVHSAPLRSIRLRSGPFDSAQDRCKKKISVLPEIFINL